MKTSYKRQFTDKKKCFIHSDFPHLSKAMVSKKDSVVKATHFFFFFCISLIRWKSEPLKHLVNGRNGIGPGWRDGGVMGEIKMKWTWFSCWRGQQGSWWEMLQQTWPLYKGSVKNTVQVSKNNNNKQTNRKTTQKTKNKTQNKLQLCQLVNKEKHFTDSKFKGSKRL